MANSNERMIVFIDCEWNGYGGGLITMALVAMDGREMYAALPMGETMTPWVAANVLPVVVTKEVELMPTRLELASRIAGFLAPYDAVHLIADWPEDIQRFCEAIVTGPGIRIDTPRLTMEVRRDMDDAQSALPHNALEDARALRIHYLSLMGDA